MASPSELDGLSPEQVQAIKRTAINTICDTGSKLNMDHLATVTAVIFLHRYYAANSLVRNDPFLVGMACLYLGGKVENSPKSVRDVLAASCELRYPGTAHRVLHDKPLYERMREQVFVAERALLYALDFRLDADSPLPPMFEVLGFEPLRGQTDKIAQFVVNLVMDSVKTEACLRFSGKQTAVACVWLALKLLKLDSHLLTKDGRLWWVALGVSEQQLEGVEACLQPLYTRGLREIYADHNLVLQSAGLASPQEVKLNAMEAAAAQASAAAAQASAAAQAPHNQPAPQAAAPTAADEPAAAAVQPKPSAAARKVAAGKPQVDVEEYDELFDNLT